MGETLFRIADLFTIRVGGRWRSGRRKILLGSEIRRDKIGRGDEVIRVDGFGDAG